VAKGITIFNTGVNEYVKTHSIPTFFYGGYCDGMITYVAERYFFDTSIKLPTGGFSGGLRLDLRPNINNVYWLTGIVGTGQNTILAWWVQQTIGMVQVNTKALGMLHPNGKIGPLIYSEGIGPSPETSYLDVTHNGRDIVVTHHDGTNPKIKVIDMSGRVLKNVTTARLYLALAYAGGGYIASTTGGVIYYLDANFNELKSVSSSSPIKPTNVQACYFIPHGNMGDTSNSNHENIWTSPLLAVVHAT